VYSIVICEVKISDSAIITYSYETCVCIRGHEVQLPIQTTSNVTPHHTCDSFIAVTIIREVLT
jgi:hypothetical protein